MCRGTSSCAPTAQSSPLVPKTCYPDNSVVWHRLEYTRLVRVNCLVHVKEEVASVQDEQELGRAHSGPRLRAVGLAIAGMLALAPPSFADLPVPFSSPWHFPHALRSLETQGYAQATAGTLLSRFLLFPISWGYPSYLEGDLISY